ncbi:hypothetical protein E0H47_10350 [Rhizobium leguminosarum bv. viciae]|nr:hypothetical protein E0H47_10350 [Rhizobium leguminosarum bv. viciae]
MEGIRSLELCGCSLKNPLPPSTEAQILSRSRLAAEHGIIALNSPDTIDSDCRGDLRVILFNASTRHSASIPGDHIAQLVIAAPSGQRSKLRRRWNHLVEMKAMAAPGFKEQPHRNGLLVVLIGFLDPEFGRQYLNTMNMRSFATQLRENPDCGIVLEPGIRGLRSKVRVVLAIVWRVRSVFI